MVQIMPIILPGFLTVKTHKTKALHNLEHRVLEPSCALSMMSNSLGIVDLKVIIFILVHYLCKFQLSALLQILHPSIPSISSASCAPQEDLAEGVQSKI